ncbi:unnamed protein product, partial [Brenthis ino]
MPKRKTKDKIEYYKSKLRKLENKSRRRIRCLSPSSDSEQETRDTNSIGIGDPVTMSSVIDAEPGTSMEAPNEGVTGPEVCMNSPGDNNVANSSTVPVLDPSILAALGEITDETPEFERTERDNTLFGSDLSEKIKASKTIVKQGKLAGTFSFPAEQRRGARRSQADQLPHSNFYQPVEDQSHLQAACLNATSVTQELSPSSTQPSYAGCGDTLREAFLRRNIPVQAIDLMLASLSDNTKKQYSVSYKLWWQFCKTNNMNIFDSTVAKIISFLTEEFNKAESSLSDFAKRKVHYTASNPLKKELFTADTRPASLRNLYEKATTDRLSASILDQLRRDSQHSQYLLCTPVLSSKRRRIHQKVDVDIETHIPSVVEHLRKWTSKEAVGDVTAMPDASMRIASSVTLTPDELSECGSGDDEPIDHRLPSPEEQLRVIASKFPPEVVAIDTSGKFFDRMCSSRKSLHVETISGETDTVKRRTRTRKPRGKRRNTISGTDQKELREAIAGDTTNAVASEEIEDNTVVRSRSSDLLKKSPTDNNAKKSHFNSLKQWGKNRLKMIGRSPSASRDSFKESKIDKSNESKLSVRLDDEAIQETVVMRKKRPDEEDRRTHLRCASYSSSEKSIGVPSSIQNTATISAGVRLRGSSTQRRSRRSGVGKDEPHSSSGNWSASSESGRTSIGSEITTTTVPPKSTTSAATSNNSLNFHHGPPSSIISRRRFLNTSGSGSVTSEGTLTPDIIHDLHEDLETSSEFSCDTEGYYTSFHMDSGLKTLKEEEISPSTPLHSTIALSNSSNSQSLSAENEYELFGKGSTSTTTSSAGTVCTTLMAADSDRSLVIGPTVPERKSSLAIINRSRGSINSNLERATSFPKSPFNSLRYNNLRAYTDKPVSSFTISDTNTSTTVTISKNVGTQREITAVVEVHAETDIESAKKSTGTSSPDSGHNTSSSPIEDSVSSAHGKNSLSEQDYSESSDLEGTDRIERIRYKTTINSSRIPSMCVITPTNSDDESVTSNKSVHKKNTDRIDQSLAKSESRPKLDLPNEERHKDIRTSDAGKTCRTQNQIKASLHPFNNFMCRLKGVLPNKLSNKKSPAPKDVDMLEDFYDSGDYVTIADVKNNNQKVSLNHGTYANNDIVKKNLQAVLSGKLSETEYVSLNELPNCLNESKDYLEHGTNERQSGVLDNIQRKGAKVTLDSQGQVIYSSDTLKRRKGAHTTFEPGPFVQEICPTTSVIQRESADVVKITDETDFPYAPPSKPTSPQLGKMIIKAPIDPRGVVTTEFVTLPIKPSTIISATPVTAAPVSTSTKSETVTKSSQDLPRVVEVITRTGAYVNIHDAEGVSLSPTKDDIAGKNIPKTSKVINDSHFENSNKSLDEIIPFVPNFQTSIMLKKCKDFNKAGDKVAEVMKMFKSNVDENVEHIESINKSLNTKIKRSDSYKLANSPLMPIKKLLKFDTFANNAKKVNSFEMIQAEIAADLLREQINYPPTVSPKLGHKETFDDFSKCECINDNESFVDNKFESELSALALSPLSTPFPKRHTIALVPDNRDRAIDMLSAILDSDPDTVCVLHSPPACPLPPGKVTVPFDGSLHRARILSISESEYGTEIW